MEDKRHLGTAGWRERQPVSHGGEGNSTIWRPREDI